MWHNLGEREFTIVEFGAGSGILSRDILVYLKNNSTFYRKLHYCIIEKSATMREIEKSHLPEIVYWHENLEELNGFEGCILSNELVDNFSVHQVEMADGLMEVMVDYDSGFKEVLLPAPVSVVNYVDELGISLPRGFRTEINIEATEWIETIAASLSRGYVMTIDYGYESQELYHPSRKQGTLRCYNKHRVNNQVYESIGSQDITSHVNFTALSHWGTKYGLTNCGYTDQCHFLLSLGFKDYLNKVMSAEKDILSAARKLVAINNTLLLDMGMKFKVLIQKKNVIGGELTGLNIMPAKTNPNIIEYSQ